MFNFMKKKGTAANQQTGHQQPPPSALKNSLLSLEQRLMFDAAASATAAEVATEQVAQEQAEAAVSGASSHDSTDGENGGGEDVVQALTNYMPAEKCVEVAFVDPTVPNYQEVLAGMDPNIEVIMLDGGQDGVEQMAEALSGRSGIDAIHLISHGSSGELQLGTGTLNAESMSTEYADEFATIRSALSDHADLLVYGCSFGEGVEGSDAVNLLAELTGADVAASSDATGHIDLGGDWEFEVQAGSIETDLALTDTTQMNWAGILGTETVKDTFSSTSYGNNNGTQSWSTSWSETDAGGSGASGGDVRVNSGQLRIDTDNVGNAISRGVDLSRATSATLTFSYTNSLVGADRIELRVSTDGGTNYQTISGGIFSNATNTGSSTASFDLSGYMSANTKIQFIVTGTGGGDRLYVDNVQVSYEAGPTNAAPTISNVGGDRLSYTEGAGAVVIDQGANALVSDSDSANFDTGALTVSIPVGAEPAEDVLSIRNQGTGAGQIGVSGSNVTYGGVTIGTFSGGAGGNNLVVTFNSNATSTAVTALVTNITYEDINNDAPAEGSFTIRFALTDGDGGTSANYDVSAYVSGVNDAPTDLTLSANTVAENAVNGTVVGTLTATDPDISDTKTYSLTDSAGGRFAINSSTGVLTVANGSLLNYESATSHAVTVRVTDRGGLTYNETFTINLTDVNEAPPVISSNGGGATASITVSENTTTVTTVTATDADTRQTLAYAISGGADAAKFMINSSTGALSFISAPNYETPTDSGGNNVYDVTVQVSDGKGGTTTQAIAVTVTNVNEGPTDLALSANSVAENASTGTVVGTVSGTDPDAGDTKTYSLTDTAGGRFAIHASTGVITVADGSLLNYESAASHNLIVQVTDSGGQSYTEQFTITLTNVNEGPTDLALSANSVAENATTGTVVGTVSGTDPDAGDTKTYSLTDTAGGRFAINASTGEITVADGSLLNYEAATSHNLTVQVTDSGGQSYTEQFTITLTNVNEGPTDLSLSANSVAENATTGTVVGTVSGTDPDAGDTKTYSLTDTAGGRFAINASTGVITVADGSLLNYEAAASHNLTVQVTDSGGQSYTEQFTINLTNVNEGPTDLALSANTVVENASTGTVVGTVSGTDPDAGDTKTYSLTDTAGGRFAINASTGVITVADGSLLNYEAATSHSLTVQVTDSGGQHYTEAFTIHLSNVNEGPSDLALSANSVAEHASTGTVVGTVTGTDPDAGDTKTYSLTDTAGGRFAIDPTTGVITVADGSLLNYEAATSHNLTVQVTDSGGQHYTESFTIALTNVNEGPTDLSLSANSVAEHASTGTVVGTVTGTDVDAGDTKTYSLTDTAGGRFAIDPGTGQLTVANGSLLNYESATSHTVTVQVTDSGGQSYTEAFTINLSNVNEGPSDLSLSANSVAEHAITGTVVGIVTGTDVDAGDTKTYSLTDTAGGRFAINASTGVITVADGSLLNYEAATSHSLTVQVTDSGGQSYTESFTIALTNVNEGPTDLSLSASTVAENAGTGTVVGTVTGTDVDAGDTKTYSLTDTAGGRFAIDASTGQLTVADGGLLNYEVATSHSVTVRVTDSGGQHYTETFTINLSNVNEGPSDLSLSANSVAEHAITGTVVGIVTGTDVDAGDTKTYSLTDTAGGRFAINASTGVITVADGSLLNYEAATSHSVTVRVTDAGGQTYDKTFSIGVTNVNEGPRSSQGSSGVGPSLVASLLQSVGRVSESSRISASSSSAVPDTRTNDSRLSDDSKNSVKWNSLPEQKTDALGSDATHQDLGSEDGMHPTGTSNMAESVLNPSSSRDGTAVSRDLADAQSVARLEPGQVPRPHSEKAENVSSDGSNGLSMPMLAGLVEVALQGGFGTEDNLGTSNTQMRKRYQAASEEKKSQPQPVDDQEAPPSAA